MAEMNVVKHRRLVNPGRRKRKMSPAQIRFFGTKRQRAALKTNRRTPKQKRPTRATSYRMRRRKNVGHILTVFPAMGNPGRKRRKRDFSLRKSAKRVKRFLLGNRGKRIIIVNKGGSTMAKRRKQNSSHRRVVIHRRRRRSAGTRLGRSWSNFTKRRRKNPGIQHRRRHNVMRRRHNYRRNPGFLSGTGGRVMGVIGGIAVTKLLTGFLPTSLSSGILGYLATGAVAWLQGTAVGKVSKNASLGQDFMVGGLAYLTTKVLNDLLPSIGGYSGISGMGLIGGSSFYTPQVNQSGNMGAFVLPSAITGAMAVPATSAGMGRARRQGRMM